MMRNTRKGPVTGLYVLLLLLIIDTTNATSDYMALGQKGNLLQKPQVDVSIFPNPVHVFFRCPVFLTHSHICESDPCEGNTVNGPFVAASRGSWGPGQFEKASSG